MASIRKEITVDAGADEVWDAVRDWSALDQRLAAGFATDCRRDGGDRIVTFVTGAVLRERIVTCDDEARRLVWSIVDGPYSHHNGAAEVRDDGAGGTRFIWTSDVLPDELAGPTAQMMDRGLQAIRVTLMAPIAVE